MLAYAAADNLGLRVTWLMQKHCRPYRDTPGHLAYAEILEHLTGPHDGCSHGCIIVSGSNVYVAEIFKSNGLIFI